MTNKQKQEQSLALIDSLPDMMSLLSDNQKSRIHNILIHQIKNDPDQVKLRGAKTKFDAIAGGAGGALSGGTAGVLLSKRFDKKGDSLAKTIARRVIGGLVGGTAGGVAGAGLGVVLGETALMDKLYQKLGVTTQNKALAIRDMAGRLDRYIESEKGPLHVKDTEVKNMMRIPRDYEHSIFNSIK